MKFDEHNQDINVLQVDPNELKRYYRSSTKFQVGDSQIVKEPLKQNHFHSRSRFHKYVTFFCNKLHTDLILFY